MKGYALYEKGKDRPIEIFLENDQGDFVGVLVFETRKGIQDSVDIEPDEEIRRVEF